MPNPANPSPQAPDLGATGAKAILLAGTLAGLVLIACGIYFTAQWWGVVTGGLEQWHKDWWRMMICELLVFGGLAVMFGALQVARSEERTNPGLRRLLYGYNAVLTSLLVLTILVHVNVFTYLPLAPFTWAQQTYDWTGTSLYSLSPGSKELLQRLDKPVKVYVILPSGDEVTLREMRTLLDNCRAVNRNIEVEELSPDLSPQRVDQLMKDYQMPEREGLLVVYGPPEDRNNVFISPNDFAPRRAGGGLTPGGGKERVEFKGEAALISALQSLMEGKAQPVIYFTQANGELDLNNSFDTSRDDRGLGLLRDRLTRAKYDVRELKLGVGTDKVPDDAAAVVIARPTVPFSPQALDALRAYLKPTDPKARPGKLILLFDVVKNPDGTMLQTGLEDFALKELGVRVDNDRVVAARNRDPLDVVAVANPQSQNPMLENFQGVAIRFHEARTVHGAERPPAGGASDFQAETIFLAHPQLWIWEETNLNTDVAAEVDSLLKPERRDELQKKISQEPLPLAVAVTQLGGPTDPNDPHGFMHRQQQPRALVFGDATWVSNRRMGEGGLFDLFTAGLAWLRERPNLAQTTEAKERPAYVVRPDEEGQFYTKVIWLPMALLTVGIIGLGTGVWFIRRR